ncbi:MAG: hypothetical protein OEV76_07570 [Anaerolineae bacterium]|nr:hypothetical protein [Anaerolineae bacterium]
MGRMMGAALLLSAAQLMILAGCGGPATQVPAPTGAPAESPTVPPEPSPTPQPTATEIAPAVPTETVAPPPPAATPTVTQPPTSAPGPSILAFQITPSVTANLGDVLAMYWQATGERAELCPVGPTGPVEDRCRDVAVSGNTQWTTDEEAMSYTGFALRAWSGTSSTLKVVEVKLQCQNLRQWFFPNPPQNCPSAQAATSYAAGQYFEHGFMIWTEEPDTFYVFYEGQDAAGFQTFDWVLDPQSMLKPGASPDNRVGEPPPAGLFEPVSGFGMIWRGEVNAIRPEARQRLGWATGPEFAFDSAHQCMTLSLTHYWVCFQRGPRGEILRLHPDSTAQVRLVWEEW